MDDLFISNIAAEDIALISKNQSIYINNMIDLNNDVNAHSLLADIKQINGYLTTKILENLRISELVDLKPLEYKGKPNGHSYILKLELESIEREYIDTIAAEIAMQFDQIVYNDLRTAASTRSYIDANLVNDMSVAIRKNIKEICQTMYSNNAKRYPNWLIASSDLIEHIKKSCDEFKPAPKQKLIIGTRSVGEGIWKIDDDKVTLKLYDMMLWPNESMLFGYKSTKNSGYCFHPELLFIPLIKKIKNQYVVKLLTTFNKQLRSDKSYAITTVENFD